MLQTIYEEQCIQQTTELLQELGLEIVQLTTDNDVAITIIKLQYGVHLKMYINVDTNSFNCSIYGTTKTWLPRTYYSESVTTLAALKLKLITIQQQPNYLQYKQWWQTCTLEQQAAYLDSLLSVKY